MFIFLIYDVAILPPSHHSGRVTGLVYSPTGHYLYSGSSVGSLALYSCQESHAPKLLRLLGNVLAKGGTEGERGGAAPSGTTPAPEPLLALSEDGSRLAFVGPHNFTVTVLEAETLDEVLRIDITPVTSSSRQPGGQFVDSGRLVSFSPNSLDQLLVVTQQARLLSFSASSGQLLREVGLLHGERCSALAVSGNGRYLLTAGEQVLKVWDHTMTKDLNFQVREGGREVGRRGREVGRRGRGE